MRGKTGGNGRDKPDAQCGEQSLMICELLSEELFHARTEQVACAKKQDRPNR